MQLNVHDEAITFSVGMHPLASNNAYMDKAGNCPSCDVAIGKLWNVAIQDGPRRFVHSIAGSLFVLQSLSLRALYTFEGKVLSSLPKRLNVK